MAVRVGYTPYPSCRMRCAGCVTQASGLFKPKCTCAAAGRFECRIKGCNHPVPHRPATRAGETLSRGFQPLFRIFLAGSVLSLFVRCNQICYHLPKKCRSFNESYSFKCAITTILFELEVFLNGRRESEIPDADRSRYRPEDQKRHTVSQLPESE